MKKLILALLVATFVPGMQVRGSDAALGAGIGFIGGTIYGRSSAPRGPKTVYIQQEAPPEPRNGRGRERLRRLESDVDELRDQFDQLNRKLDKILRKLDKQ